MKTYGPYKRKDGRQHMVIVLDDGRKTTKSYPRHVMEQSLGRLLTKEETVDHINNIKTDDRLENFQLLSLADNIRKQAALSPRKVYKFICPQCNQPAEKFENFVKNNKKRRKTGPYCSRRCAGKATYVNPWNKGQ